MVLTGKENTVQLVCVSDSITTMFLNIQQLFQDMLQHVRIESDNDIIRVYRIHTEELLFHCDFSRDEANRADEKINVYLTITKGTEPMLYIRVFHELVMKLKEEQHWYVKLV